MLEWLLGSPLRDSAEAHLLREKGGTGKILVWCGIHRANFLPGDLSGRIMRDSKIDPAMAGKALTLAETSFISLILFSLIVERV